MPQVFAVWLSSGWCVEVQEVAETREEQKEEGWSLTSIRLGNDGCPRNMVKPQLVAWFDRYRVGMAGYNEWKNKNAWQALTVMFPEPRQSTFCHNAPIHSLTGLWDNALLCCSNSTALLRLSNPENMSPKSPPKLRP